MSSDRNQNESPPNPHPDCPLATLSRHFQPPIHNKTTTSANKRASKQPRNAPVTDKTRMETSQEPVKNRSKTSEDQKRSRQTNLPPACPENPPGTVKLPTHYSHFLPFCRASEIGDQPYDAVPAERVGPGLRHGLHRLLVLSTPKMHPRSRPRKPLKRGSAPLERDVDGTGRKA